MILDFSSCEISVDIDVNNDNGNQGDTVPVQPHLTQDKWVVVTAANSPPIQSKDLKDSHIDLSIIKRIKTHDQRQIQLVPLSAIRGPCFVIQNKNYCDGSSDRDASVNDGTAYIVDPMDKWANVFLEEGQLRVNLIYYLQ